MVWRTWILHFNCAKFVRSFKCDHSGLKITPRSERPNTPTPEIILKVHDGWLEKIQLAVAVNFSEEIAMYILLLCRKQNNNDDSAGKVLLLLQRKLSQANTTWVFWINRLKSDKIFNKRRRFIKTAVSLLKNVTILSLIKSSIIQICSSKTLGLINTRYTKTKVLLSTSIMSY